MSRSTRKRIRIVLYSLLGAAIAWQAVAVVNLLRRPAEIAPLRKISVHIDGNVERPGTYRVPLGTTQFEILKVAGVRMTSDLSGLSLGSQLEANENVSVGTLDKPVELGAHVRLEFYLGELGLESLDGKDRPIKEGMNINEGDRVRTGDDAQAEFSINSYSRVDMDNNTEIAFDKIGTEGEKRAVEVFQWSGLCWYKVVYSTTQEMIKVVTPLAQITVAGKGSDFTVETSVSAVTVDNREGLLLVERPASGEAMNLIAGQQVTVHADGRPFEVAKTAPEAGVAERFAQLNKTKTEVLVKYMPLNILLCSPLGVFHLVSVQFDRSEVHTVHVPSNLYVADFAQGFATIREAYLYGGSAFASTLLERIMNVRVPKYAELDKEDVLRAVSTMGGIKVRVDNAAASAMRMRSGRHTMREQQVVDFMKPGLSGEADAVRRQNEVIRAIFDGFRSRSIVLTALMADQMLSGVESNVTSAELMKHYANFRSRPNWAMEAHSLPARSISVGGKAYLEPVLEGCRGLLTQG
ncbi:MAG: hypothetical protein GF418_02475 [Chitinivibrionales bacterium]|nr:hypothetical protein [Chitinivibrionales bacterium]MBD3394467.1 hypothetical protein [Chitinivibrionales bacterium]